MIPTLLFRWSVRAPVAAAREAIATLHRARQARRVLASVVWLEFQKKYAGSVLGVLWHPLYAALLLATYSFVYLVVFRARFAEFGSFEYVLFIFSGMVPYLGFSDAVATATPSVKANLSLLRNSVFPLELVPIRQLIVSMGGLLISLGILLVLLIVSGHAGLHLLYLPVPLLLLFVSLAGLVWFTSAAAVLIPDVTYVVNLLLLLFLFISPIGYPLSLVPGAARIWVLLNPLTYLVESFRFALMGLREIPLWTDAVFGVFALVLAVAGAGFFRRLMPVFTDYE
ncbi:MAG TPA: ABC transporter permease [Vicinamibacterales bacterium]|nr:ABC transporter permease [Vicinamibacterales bacterium]